MPIIAEDLGVITADVHELRQSIGAPGMVVLQFAWGSDAANVHLPHNHYENSVCYPGDLPMRMPAPEGCQICITRCHQDLYSWLGLPLRGLVSQTDKSAEQPSLCCKTPGEPPLVA